METKEKEVFDCIIVQLSDKLKRSGLSANDITPQFNLTKTGLLDSLSFVNLVAFLEHKYDMEVNYEEAFLDPDFTSISGLTGVILKGIK
ncbi:MAG TPA: acyl carrier protein [Bacteroidales bacterium]|nr:acyl carrier protein [Bacteroidales bacterium]